MTLSFMDFSFIEVWSKKKLFSSQEKWFKRSLTSAKCKVGDASGRNTTAHIHWVPKWTQMWENWFACFVSRRLHMHHFCTSSLKINGKRLPSVIDVSSLDCKDQCFFCIWTDVQVSVYLTILNTIFLHTLQLWLLIVLDAALHILSIMLHHMIDSIFFYRFIILTAF